MFQQYVSPNRTTFGRAHGYIAQDPRAQQGHERAMGSLEQQGANYRAGLQAAGQRDALGQSQGRFNALLPMLQGALGQADLVGGVSREGPQINASPVWSGQQIGEQVNAAQARNNASTQSGQRGLSQSFAGRGFGSNSPLLQALSTGMDMNRMRQNSEDTREINWGAAQGNARHVLAAQQAQEAQIANRNQEDIERRRSANNYKSSLLGILGGMV